MPYFNEILQRWTANTLCYDALIFNFVYHLNGKTLTSYFHTSYKGDLC